MNVLLSSASNKIPLLRALQHAVKRVTSNGIVTAGDLNSNVLSRHFCDEFWQMPATIEQHKDEIVSALKQRGITHVLPSRDGELLFWAQLKSSLKAHNIHVIVSSPEAVEQCLDKLRFGNHSISGAESNCIIPTSSALEALKENTDSERYVVKERFGAGSKSIGVNLNSSEAAEHAKKLSTPIYQPHIDGQEISVDAWLSESHEVKAAMCRVRALVINGESQITYTQPQSLFLCEIEKALTSLKLSGPVVLQALVSNNKLHIIECNTRFGGASTLGIKAGVDSLYWSLMESSGENVDSLPVNLSREKITQVRAATDYYL